MKTMLLKSPNGSLTSHFLINVLVTMKLVSGQRHRFCCLFIVFSHNCVKRSESFLAPQINPALLYKFSSLRFTSPRFTSPVQCNQILLHLILPINLFFLDRLTNLYFLQNFCFNLGITVQSNPFKIPIIFLKVCKQIEKQRSFAIIILIIFRTSIAQIYVYI